MPPKFAYTKELCDYNKNEILQLGLDPDSKKRKLCYQILKGLGGTVKLHEKNRKILLQCGLQFRQLITKSAGIRIDQLLSDMKPKKFENCANVCIKFLKGEMPEGIIKNTTIASLSETSASLKIGFEFKDASNVCVEDAQMFFTNLTPSARVFIRGVSFYVQDQEQCDVVKKFKLKITDVIKFKKALGVQEVLDDEPSQQLQVVKFLLLFIKNRLLTDS